jgi:hypothetical protein
MDGLSARRVGIGRTGRGSVAARRPAGLAGLLGVVGGVAIGWSSFNSTGNLLTAAIAGLLAGAVIIWLWSFRSVRIVAAIVVALVIFGHLQK